MTVTKIHRQHIPNDFENNELLNVVLQHLVSPPVIQTEGKIYYNSFKRIPFYSDGVEWIPFFGKPVQYRYSTQALMLAAQPIHNNGYIYYISDQDIYYEYLGTTAGTIADYNAIGGSGSGSTYTHPAYTAINQSFTGAVVLGSIVTDDIGSVVSVETRTLTLLNLGFTGDSNANFYAHPEKVWVDKTALTGSTVISNLTIDALGHPTDWVTRNLTAADIVAEPAFVKGSIIQGAAISLTGTLTGRLVGTGDITIAHLDTSTQVNVTNSEGVVIRGLGFDTYGHVISVGSIDLDPRYHRKHVLMNNSSEFQFIGNVEGMQVRANTTGSTGFPSSLGSNWVFYTGSNDAFSVMSRAFSIYREYNTQKFYLGTPGSGESNYLANWVQLYHTGNTTPSAIGAEPAFEKGSLVQGSNVILTGTLIDRLVGAGNVTIEATVPVGSVPVTESFTYVDTNIFTLSNSDVTPIYVTLNGQVLREGSIYDYTISGSTLTISEPLLIDGEISIKYYTALANLTTIGRNIDGGAPDSVYLPIQNINGGTP